MNDKVNGDLDTGAENLTSADSGAPGRIGWPWGANRPTTVRRILVASAVAVACGLVLGFGPSVGGTDHTDFGEVWFGAKTMLQHRNPYARVGPGLEFNWDWGLFYPGTALALAIPVAGMSETTASTAFVMFGVWLVVFGSTRTSWHRLPAFASAAFVIAVRAGQWSPLIAAGWFVPTAAIAWGSKPTLGLAMLLAAPTSRHRFFAIVGGIVLVAISMALLPSWPWDWAGKLSETEHMVPPFLQPGGFLIALALLRWRTPEAAL
ncbi:MAG: hypothetical protein ABIW84_03450, partial [Ilumatobacteraceae bacterium]